MIRWPSSAGVHLACEQASNILTKVLEWGRLAGLLGAVARATSPTTAASAGRPLEVPRSRRPLVGRGAAPELHAATMDHLFDDLQRAADPEDRGSCEGASGPSGIPGRTGTSPRRLQADDPGQGAWIRCSRDLLPAATQSPMSVMYGTGQAYEAAAAPHAGSTRWPRPGQLRRPQMLVELRKVIPARSSSRVDRHGARRGVASEYLAADPGGDMTGVAAELLGEVRGVGDGRRIGRADRLRPRW